MSAFPDYSNRGRLGGSVLQFQRKAAGSGSIAAWAHQRGIKAGVPREGEPVNPGGDGWHDPRKGQQIYESIQEEGLRPLQRRFANK